MVIVLQLVVAKVKGMWERIVWKIHFVLLGGTKPLGQDIRIRQGAVCHRGNKEHGNIV